MDFALLGVCYDKTQTFRKGSSKAPSLLRNIFPKLETYVNGVDLTESAFFKDLGDIYPKDFQGLMNEMQLQLRGVKNFPVILGGEHTVTLGAVKELKPDFVVIADAHPDCEDSNGHNGVVRRIVELLGAERVLLCGIRCMSRKEEEFIKEKKIRIVSEKELLKLNGRIYLSIDFDVLDPSVMPAVGNPEPEGISINNLLEVVKALSKNLIGIDFVEFTPLSSTRDEIYSLLAGKVIYSALAEIIKAKDISKP